MNQARRAHRRRFAAPALGLLFCLAAAGCGDFGSVSGKISFDGQPLTGGTVVFTVPGKGSDSSPISPDGSYKINKVPVGTAKITVEGVKPPARDPRRPAPNMPTMPADKAPPGVTLPPYAQPGQPTGPSVVIPDKYADPNQSGLTYDVKAGSQEKSFNLPK